MIRLLLCIITALFILAKISFSSELEPFSEYSKIQKTAEINLIKENDISVRKTFRLDANMPEGDSGQKWLISNEYFDEDGNLVKFETIDEFGQAVLTSVYKYNADGLLTEMEEKDNFRTLVQKQTFSYDPFSKLIKVASVGFNDIPIQTLNFEYLPEKQTAVETIKDTLNSVISSTVYLYDKAFNKVIKTTNYTKENELDGITAFFYDEKGLNNREVYTKDTQEPFRIKYQNIYDDDNNLVKVLNISYPDKVIVTVENEYNGDNLLLSTKMADAKNEPITTITYEYITR